MHNLETNPFEFKTLLDAIRIRNHVIDMFEYANREANSERRRGFLRFVIVGGGFAGAEVAAVARNIRATLEYPSDS
jgi:NADH dehydrogenase